MRTMLLVGMLLWSVPLPGWADGMPIGDDGRFQEGETIIVGLTGSQQSRLTKDRLLVLNAEQKRQIRKVHGFSPSRLWIYETRAGENECTCSAYNRGLRFHEGLIEIPRVYLVTDQRAEEIKKELEGA